LNLLPELLKNGIDACAQSYPSSLSDKLALLSRLPDYDTVVLQKKLLSLVDFTLLRKRAKRLIYDFDDAVFIRDDQARDPVSRTRLTRFVRTVKNVDLVIAGTSILAGEALRYTERVTTLPSAVETTGVPVKKWDTDAPPRVIGWVGGGGNLHHLAGIGEALQKLATEYPIELRIVSNRELSLEGVRVVNIPWTLAGQAAEIAGFDIGVMPLPKNRWTEGKCSYKALQYMAAGVPVVATDWGYNRQVIDDYRTGLLAKDNDQFHTRIKELIDSPELAKRVGNAGRELIERVYSVEVVGARLSAIIRLLMAQPIKHKSKSANTRKGEGDGNLWQEFK
jgi:glycosyltransferase involved in cell wall biosynthesis